MHKCIYTYVCTTCMHMCVCENPMFAHIHEMIAQNFPLGYGSKTCYPVAPTIHRMGKVWTGGA